MCWVLVKVRVCGTIGVVEATEVLAGAAALGVSSGGGCAPLSVDVAGCVGSGKTGDGGSSAPVTGHSGPSAGVASSAGRGGESGVTVGGATGG